MSKQIKKIILIIAGLIYTLPAKAISLPDPLNETDPNKIIGSIINSILGLVGTIALLMFIYGGVTILISLGNDTKIKQGRDTMLWASLGLLIIFGSYALAKFALDIASLK